MGCVVTRSSHDWREGLRAEPGSTLDSATPKASSSTLPHNTEMSGSRSDLLINVVEVKVCVDTKQRAGPVADNPEAEGAMEKACKLRIPLRHLRHQREKHGVALSMSVVARLFLLGFP